MMNNCYERQSQSNEQLMLIIFIFYRFKCVLPGIFFAGEMYHNHKI